MDFELRWWQLTKTSPLIFQIREREGPNGEGWWGAWREIDIVTEEEEYEKAYALDGG